MFRRTAVLAAIAAFTASCDTAAVREEYLDEAAALALREIVATKAAHPVDAFDPGALPAGISAAAVSRNADLRLETVEWTCEAPNPCKVEPAGVEVWVSVGAFEAHRPDSVTIEVWLQDFSGTFPVIVSYLVNLIREHGRAWRVVEVSKNAEV